MGSKKEREEQDLCNDTEYEARALAFLRSRPSLLMSLTDSQIATLHEMSKMDGLDPI